MCGILGIYSLSGSQIIDERRFAEALGTLHHRGPDAQNTHRFGNEAIFGHTRLSIIDLSNESNQPMSVLDRYWVTYNGEIYNYLELRTELEQLGARFRTQGDTEVLLYAYAFWGSACVRRFNGMWAFAIFDTVDKKLFCSRDRFGVKPFNYVESQGQLIFASEIKAILSYRPTLAQVEYEAISNYCRTSVGAQQPQTWFKNIKRLSPGHNLTICRNKIETERYWHYPTHIDRRLTFEEARERYAEIFKDAVRLRLRSDVPVGITLSSGIDSSSIAYSMHEIDPRSHHCFTSQFDAAGKGHSEGAVYKQTVAIDESISAGNVAKALDYVPHPIEINYKNFLPDLEQIIFHLESGHSSPSIIPHMQLLRAAKKHVTVVMEEQGADELLGGYALEAVWPAIADLAKRGRLVEVARSLKAFSETYQTSYAAKMAIRAMSNDFPSISRAQQHISGVNRVFGPLMRDHTHWKDYMDLPINSSRESWENVNASALGG